jgi:hypothetical protein
MKKSAGSSFKPVDLSCGDHSYAHKPQTCSPTFAFTQHPIAVVITRFIVRFVTVASAEYRADGGYMSNAQIYDTAVNDQAPAALMLADAVERVHVTGHFDVASQTWSDREFACAGAKKHNEAM